MHNKRETKGALVLLVALLAAPCASAQVNPVPLIDLPLAPAGAVPLGPSFTLTVNGAGFAPGSVVHWSGAARATSFISSGQLTATILASDIATAKTAGITVVSPTPGGGTSNSVVFEINNPTDTVFLTRSDFQTGSEPNTVAVADFNRDGKADIATVNEGNGTVSILLGNGDGTFASPVSYSIGDAGDLESLAVGDFDGDGKLDLVVGGGPTNVFVLLGNGDGTFGPPVSFQAGGSASDVAVGDFNGDGKLDVAVSNSAYDTVGILLGNGDGTFQPPVTYPAGGRAEYVAVGDFNGDGKLDLVTANAYNPPEGISVLLGNGDGTFQPYLYYQAGTTPQSLTVADFNGDGVLDIAAGNAGDSTISVFVGNGDGTFQSQKVYPAGTMPLWEASGDFNGDGKLDLAVSGEGSTSVLLGNGDGTFQAPLEFLGGTAADSVAVADFNRDGKLDLVTADEQASAVSVLLQNVAPSALLTPTKLLFGKELLGTTSAPREAMLTNTGTAALRKGSIKTTSPDFPEENTCGSTVAVNASCTISVTFDPTESGARTGAIVVNDNAVGSPQTVSLSGTGVAIELSPAKLAFGDHKVGTSSASQTVTVTNVGTATVTFGSPVITVAGDTADFPPTNGCGATLGAGAACTIGVTFTPKATGARRATLEVNDNGGGSPQTVALSGTGK